LKQSNIGEKALWLLDVRGEMSEVRIEISDLSLWELLTYS